MNKKDLVLRKLSLNIYISIKTFQKKLFKIIVFV